MVSRCWAAGAVVQRAAASMLLPLAVGALPACGDARAQEPAGLEVLTVRVTEAECEALPRLSKRFYEGYGYPQPGVRVEVPNLDPDRVVHASVLHCDTSTAGRSCFPALHDAATAGLWELELVDGAVFVFGPPEPDHDPCRFDRYVRVVPPRPPSPTAYRQYSFLQRPR
jgi:hypothetical protein